MSTENNYAFGSFILRTDPLRLLRDGTEVPLGTRALSILLALVRHSGQALSKQRLIELVWAGAAANDNSVHVHINTLRNRIGHELIVTVAGAGYRLNAPVRAIGRAATMPLAAGTERRLLGRDAEATELAELVACRALVTVVGPAGCGKSALARALVASSTLHTDVACVDVAALEDSAQLVQAVARAVNMPPPAPGAEGEWRRQLAERDLLLLLDNCERYAAAVGDFCMQLRLASDRLRVLATSQMPLQIAGEWSLRLAGLPVPPEGATLAVAGEYSAVRLLTERVAQLQRGCMLNDENVGLIVQLVRLADGMPLAIELMAQHLEGAGRDVDALVRLLLARGAAQGVQRRDAPPRQQSLHASLQWSLALLDAEERATLSQLAVFEDGFTAAAATAVVRVPDATDAEADAVVHARLTTLVRRSLLLVDWSGPRYTLLRLVRAQLLADDAAAAGLDSARQRHAQHYADHALALRQELAQRGSNPAAWRERVEEELGNLQAALAWAVGPGRATELALRLSADLGSYCDLTGHYAQVTRPMAVALQMPAGEALRPLRQRALEAAATCELHRGQLGVAAQLYAEAGAAARAIDARPATAHHRADLGSAACSVLRGDADSAEAFLQSAMRGFEALRDRDGMAAGHGVAALIGIERDDLLQAQMRAERALDSARSGGALTTAADMHALLGHVIALAGDAQGARSHLQAALDLAIYLGAARSRLQAACALARLNARQGERGLAARQLDGVLREALQSDLQGLLPEALLTAAQLLIDNDAADALSLLCAVDAAIVEGNVHLPPWLHRHAAELQHRAAQALDPAQVEVDRTRGRSMSLTQAGWKAAHALELRGGHGDVLPLRRRVRRETHAQEDLRERASGER